MKLPYQVLLALKLGHFTINNFLKVSKIIQLNESMSFSKSLEPDSDYY
jgi:hypothetical protein